MKLYLSSYHVGSDPQILVNLVGKNKKAAVIPNAMDFLDDLKIMDEKNSGQYR